MYDADVCMPGCRCWSLTNINTERVFLIRYSVGQATNRGSKCRIMSDECMLLLYAYQDADVGRLTNINTEPGVLDIIFCWSGTQQGLKMWNYE
jgi:hypothetical protein